MEILVMVITPWMFLLMTKLSPMDLSQWARQASLDQYFYVVLKHQRWFLKCWKCWRSVEIPKSSCVDFTFLGLFNYWITNKSLTAMLGVTHDDFEGGSKYLSWKVLSNARVKMSTKRPLELMLWPIICQGLPGSWVVNLNHETVLRRRPLSNTLVQMSNGR